MTVRTAYGPKDRLQIQFTGHGKTKQAMKAECDINNIMARYQKTGVIDFTNTHEARYGDCTGIDFENSLQEVAAARELFSALPSGLRTRFENDPAQFLDFVNDEKNEAEAIELGIITKPEKKAEPEKRQRRKTSPEVKKPEPVDK